MWDGHSKIDLAIDYDAHFAYGRAFPDISAEDRAAAMGKYAPVLARNLAMSQHMRRLFPHPGMPAPAQTAFARRGSEVFDVPDADWAAFADALAPARGSLEERLAAIAPEKRKRRDELLIVDKSFSGVHAALEHLLRDVGVIDGVSAYLGDDVVITSPALLFSEHHASYLRNRFADHGKPDSPLNYLHIDTNIQTIKLMVYLEPVSEEEGPFCYMPRDRYAPSLLNQAIRKANDQSGLQSSSHAQFRRAFMALPPLYRQKAVIGDDLLPDDPRVPLWQSSEQRYTCDRPTIVAFDGDHGFHRGNLIRRGQRKVLNVSLLSHSYSAAFADINALPIGFSDRELDAIISIGSRAGPEAEAELEAFANTWFEDRVAPRIAARRQAKQSARKAAEARNRSDKLLRAASDAEAAAKATPKQNLLDKQAAEARHRADKLHRAAAEAEADALAAEAESANAQGIADELDREFGPAAEPPPAMQM